MFTRLLIYVAAGAMGTQIQTLRLTEEDFRGRHELEHS
jgi:methionine synthase I (cobalamin-dependent)